MADTLACPVFSPSPRHPGSCGSSSTFPRPHWVPTPSPAALCSSHTWRNGCGALPVAGGAATTGKDATVTLTLRTPVQFWRNSVSSVISLSLCPFAVTPLRYPASCSVSASRCPIFACVFLINQLMFLQLRCSPARALWVCIFLAGLREDPQQVAEPLLTFCGRRWLVRWERTGIIVQVPKVPSGQSLKKELQ